MKLMELFGLAFIIAFIASQGGISGAYLLVPSQIYILGLLSPVISSTNFMYNLLATPLAIYRYAREGRLIAPLAIVLAIGGSLGSILGTYVRVHLLVNAGEYRFFVDSVLLLLSAELIISSRIRSRDLVITRVSILRVSIRGLEFVFSNNTFKISLPLVFIIALLAGLIGGIYGIGGASIVAPILIANLNLPAYVTAGSTLVETLTTSTTALVAYSTLGVLPNITVGLTIGIGGLIGSYIGASVQKIMPESRIKLMLGIITGLIGVIDLLLHYFI